MNNNVIEPIAAKGIETEKEGDITMNEAVYTFRKLDGTDMFLMFKILGKIGVNEFAKCFDAEKVKELVASANAQGRQDASTMVGISVILDLVNIIVSNLPKCEAEIYQMLSNTSNLTVEEVKKLDFATFTEMVIDFVKKEEFKDFIKVVSKLFKLGN